MPEIPVIDVTTRQSTDICIAEMRMDIRYIREQLSKIAADHEDRLRTMEQTREECQQKERIKILEENVEALKRTHNQDEGAEKEKMSNREFALFLVAIVSVGLNVWQMVR